MLATAALAKEFRSKKEATYIPYGQITEPNKYQAAAGGYDYYNRQQQPYYHQSAYPYYQQQQAYQRYPYNYGHQQHYSQYDNYSPYVFQYGHQPQYPHVYRQNAFGYPNSLGYDANAFRQAPVYPSPGAQPISPPVPHPFYHPQGTYYPTQIVTVKPTVPVYPKNHTYWKNG